MTCFDNQIAKLTPEPKNNFESDLDFMIKILPGVLNTNTNDKNRKSIRDVNKTRFDNRAIPDEIA